jgi:hypothetical protein
MTLKAIRPPSSTHAALPGISLRRDSLHRGFFGHRIFMAAITLICFGKRAISLG